ncbi:hypothetical protein MRB53_036907 [Persea americana]|nr:hypothetical protein MRB53_036907 [Persea americana]
MYSSRLRRSRWSWAIPMLSSPTGLNLREHDIDHTMSKSPSFFSLRARSTPTRELQHLNQDHAGTGNHQLDKSTRESKITFTSSCSTRPTCLGHPAQHWPPLPRDSPPIEQTRARSSRLAHLTGGPNVLIVFLLAPPLTTNSSSINNAATTFTAMQSLQEALLRDPHNALDPSAAHRRGESYRSRVDDKSLRVPRARKPSRDERREELAVAALQDCLSEPGVGSEDAAAVLEARRTAILQLAPAVHCRSDAAERAHERIERTSGEDRLAQALEVKAGMCCWGSRTSGERSGSRIELVVDLLASGSDVAAERSSDGDIR